MVLIVTTLMPMTKLAFQSINPEEMPGDYYFSGMIAFFLWGHIIENHNQECVRFKKLRR